LNAEFKFDIGDDIMIYKRVFIIKAQITNIFFSSNFPEFDIDAILMNIGCNFYIPFAVLNGITF